MNVSGLGNLVAQQPEILRSVGDMVKSIFPALFSFVFFFLQLSLMKD